MTNINKKGTSQTLLITLLAVLVILAAIVIIFKINVNPMGGPADNGQALTPPSTVSPAHPIKPITPPPTTTYQSSTTAPHLLSIQPTSGQIGNTVVIQGSNFLATNTIIFGGGDINNAVVSKNGTVLTFIVPSSIGADCLPNQACPMYARVITPGPYTVSVRTANGTSNTLSYNVVAQGSPSATGMVKGQATAAVNCTTPVNGKCPTTTDYTKFGIKIYQDSTLVQQVSLDSNGSFSVNLAPGTYVIYPSYYTPGNTSTTETWKSNLPQPVTVRGGTSTSFNFTITYTAN